MADRLRAEYSALNPRIRITILTYLSDVDGVTQSNILALADEAVEWITAETDTYVDLLDELENKNLVEGDEDIQHIKPINNKKDEGPYL